MNLTPYRVNTVIEVLTALNRAGYNKLNIRSLIIIMLAHGRDDKRVTNVDVADACECVYNKAKDRMNALCGGSNPIFVREPLKRVKAVSYRGTPDNIHERHNIVRFYKLSSHIDELIK